MRRKHKKRGKHRKQRMSKHKQREKPDGKSKAFNSSPTTFTQENISHPEHNVLHPVKEKILLLNSAKNGGFTNTTTLIIFVNIQNPGIPNG